MYSLELELNNFSLIKAIYLDCVSVSIILAIQIRFSILIYLIIKIVLLWYYHILWLKFCLHNFYVTVIFVWSFFVEHFREFSPTQFFPVYWDPRFLVVYNYSAAMYASRFNWRSQASPVYNLDGSVTGSLHQRVEKFRNKKISKYTFIT